MDGFKDGSFLADVTGRGEAEASDEAGAEVRQDVAVQVGLKEIHFTSLLGNSNPGSCEKEEERERY